MTISFWTPLIRKKCRYFSHDNPAQKNKFKPYVKVSDVKPSVADEDVSHSQSDKDINNNVTSRATNPYFKPTELFNVYRFPTPSARPNIAILELGGGYKDSELNYYWTKVLNYPSNATPYTKAVLIDGAVNRQIKSDDDFEVSLDIQVIGGLFPNGKVNMYVYFAPNSYQGFYNAIQSAIYNTTTSFQAISISWGSPEVYWSSNELNAFNQLFAQAVAKGISVFVASGDNGSSDGVGDGQRHVDFPASASNVIGCGGTTLTCPSRNYSTNSTSEVCWSGSGGGVSAQFSVPSYQSSIATQLRATKRCVPDVSGNADPNTGWLIYLHGSQYVVGGTSAVAPMWSALWSNLLGTRTRTFAGPKLYKGFRTNGYHDIVSGNNGDYTAITGFDLCTGLGTPDGLNLQRYTQ